MLKVLCKNAGQRLASLRDVGIVVAIFLVEYVFAVVVGQDLAEVDVAADTDDLVAGVAAAVVVLAWFANVVFDDGYIVRNAVDVVVVADYVVIFVVVAVDAVVHAVAHIDA